MKTLIFLLLPLPLKNSSCSRFASLIFYTSRSTRVDDDLRNSRQITGTDFLSIGSVFVFDAVLDTLGEEEKGGKGLVKKVELYLS